MTMRVIFFGTPEFAVPSLRALIAMRDVAVVAAITQPDKPAGRGGGLRTSPIKRLAGEHGIPVLQPRSLRKEWESLRSELDALGGTDTTGPGAPVPYDIGIVVAFGQILPLSVLEYPTHGCLNVHASLLPRWRGAAPIQRALQAGDPETGVCLMRMDVGLDTGAVYSRATTPISPNDTGGSLHDRLALIGAELLQRDLAAIVAGTLRVEPQPDAGVTYASKITAADTVIDWTKPADEILRAVRAFSPYPGCFTTLGGKRLKILTAREVDPPAQSGARPGTVIFAQGERLLVACGARALLLEEVQLEGKRRMRIDEFLRGTQLHCGEQLGVADATP